MSSIYDALKRVQEDGRAPDYRPVPTPSGKGARFWLIVLAAIVLSSATTVILYGLWSDSATTPVQATPVKAAPAPPDPAALLREAQTRRNAGDTAGAAALYEQALAAAPGRDREAYVRLGALYFERREYDRAAATYQAALTHFRNDAVILNNLGGVLLAKGDIPGAIGYFRLASNCSKDYVEPVYNLACAYARKGDRPAALDALHKALGMHPDVRRWAAQDPDLEPIREEAMRAMEKGD